MFAEKFYRSSKFLRATDAGRVLPQTTSVFVVFRVFKTRKKTSVDRLLCFLSLDLQNDVKSQTMSKRGSNISKVFFFALDKTFCSNSWILIQSLHPILFHSAIYARGVVQTLQEIVKTNLKTPLINDSQTLSHLLRRLACGNLKLVQNWYKVAVQNVQNIKVTIVNMQMQCFAVIE